MPEEVEHHDVTRLRLVIDGWVPASRLPRILDILGVAEPDSAPDMAQFSRHLPDAFIGQPIISRVVSKELPDFNATWYAWHTINGESVALITYDIVEKFVEWTQGSRTKRTIRYTATDTLNKARRFVAERIPERQQNLYIAEDEISGVWGLRVDMFPRLLRDIRQRLYKRDRGEAIGEKSLSLLTRLGKALVDQAPSQS